MAHRNSLTVRRILDLEKVSMLSLGTSLLNNSSVEFCITLRKV